MNPDLLYETVVRFQHVEVEAPGVKDLRERLISPDLFDPVRASWHALRSSPAKTTHAAFDGWLADPAAFARQHGPAIIVIYTPRSVADLCLRRPKPAAQGPHLAPKAIVVQVVDGDPSASTCCRVDGSKTP